MRNNKLILVINPGSTSSKIAIYQNEVEINSKTLHYSPEELRRNVERSDLINMHREAVLNYLNEMNIPISSFSAIAARGGVVGELDCGAYLVNEAFVEASRNSYAFHGANIAAIIGYEMANPAGIKTYVYDAVCGCGIPDPIFTITGLPEIKKDFLTHVLNSRAVSIQQAKTDGKELSDTTYIVAHMGGGITINLIHQGRVLDFIGDDEGTFSPERAGGLPCRSLVKLCYSGKYSEKEMQKRMKGQGGLVAYTGSNDLRTVEAMIANGDKTAEICYQAMAMQIAKDIGALSTVVKGKINKIILTGGMAHSKSLTDLVSEKITFIAPVSIIPGTCEMQALASGIYRVLEGKEEAKIIEPLK